MTIGARRITWLIVALGVAARAWYLFQRGAFWVDEAYLGLNVLPRGLGELFQPMAYDQYAPPLYLLLIGLLVKLGAASALALRSPAFVAGVATLLLCAWVAMRLLPKSGAILATAVASLSPALVRYSTDFKPYMFTALATALMVALAVRLLERPDDRRRWVEVGLGGLAAIGVANSAPLVLAAVGGVIALSPASRRAAHLRTVGVTFAMLWAIAFALVYVIFYLPAARDPYMNQFFGQSFLTPPALYDASVLRRLAVEVIVEGFQGSVSSSWRGVTLLYLCAGLAGAVAMSIHRGPWLALLIVGPILAAIGASVLHKWPIVPRTMVFAIPLGAILVGSAVAAVLRLRSRVLALGLAAVVSVGAVGPAAVALAEGAFPLPDDGQMTVLRAGLAARGRGEPLYVSAEQAPSWVFHSTNWSQPDTARLRWAVGIFESHHRGRSRGRPVEPGEGWDESRAYEGRLEVMGISTGMQWLHDGYTTAVPDSGWASSEASRLQAVGASHVWLLMLPYDGPAQVHLSRELARRGAQRVDSVGDQRSRAVRFALPALSPEARSPSTKGSAEDA